MLTNYLHYYKMVLSEGDKIMLKVKDLIKYSLYVEKYHCYLFLSNKQVKNVGKYVLSSKLKKHEYANIEINTKQVFESFRDVRGKWFTRDISQDGSVWFHLNSRAGWTLEFLADFLDNCNEIKLNHFTVNVDKNTNKNTMTIIFELK